MPGWYDVQVNFQSGNSTSQEGGCGETVVAHSGSTILGGAVNVWSHDHNGTPCDYVETLTHELGHLLGFDNVSYPWCEGRIMYVPAGGGRSLTSTECAAADAWWATDWESPDQCDWPQPPQGCDPQAPPGSPIVIDLNGDGLELTGLDQPVSFDINGDGSLDRVGWVSGRGMDAFLWLDWNSNGVVDDGTELFGNYTRLLDGTIADHGFERLAELDLRTLGGNEDGFIDSEDDGYAHLRLWTDANRDGRSVGETLSLETMGVVRLELRYRRIGKHDKHGNLLLYKARAWIRRNGRTRVVTATDVFFVVE